MTRGYKNNNPGNIRLTPDTWQGEIKGDDKDFKKFKSMSYGYRALFILLRTYIQNRGYNTIRKIISVYAPTNENDTQSYISSVSRRTGIDPDEELDINNSLDIKNIVAAISYHENGIAPDLQQIDDGYKLFKA